MGGMDEGAQSVQSGEQGGVEVRLVAEGAFLREARALTADYMRIWYFDEEPLDAGDQGVLDEFCGTYSPARTCTAWVALVGGEAVGVVLLDAGVRGERRCLNAHRLYVRPGWRRRGVATALIAAVARHSEVTARPARAMVPVRRSDALSLLLRSGFVETGGQHGDFVEVVRDVVEPPAKDRFAMPPHHRITAEHRDSLVAGAERLLAKAAEAAPTGHRDPNRGGSDPLG